MVLVKLFTSYLKLKVCKNCNEKSDSFKFSLVSLDLLGRRIDVRNDSEEIQSFLQEAIVSSSGTACTLFGIVHSAFIQCGVALCQLPSLSVFQALGLSSSLLKQLLFSTAIEKHSILHQSYADDSHLQNSAPRHQLPDLSKQKCIDDIKSWMPQDKLKLNDDNIEAKVVSSG